jgi:hypothetical protein
MVLRLQRENGQGGFRFPPWNPLKRLLEGGLRAPSPERLPLPGGRRTRGGELKRKKAPSESLRGHTRGTGSRPGDSLDSDISFTEEIQITGPLQTPTTLTAKQSSVPRSGTAPFKRSLRQRDERGIQESWNPFVAAKPRRRAFFLSCFTCLLAASIV